MSEIKTPQAGEWWEHAKLKRRCFIVGVDVRGHIAFQVNELENPLRIWTYQVDHFVSDNVYLSGCDGWTWKPPEPVKPKLQLEVGKRYVKRNGVISGWLQKNEQAYFETHPFRDGISQHTYKENGIWKENGAESEYDLIAEYVEPTTVTHGGPYVSIDVHQKVVAERDALLKMMREIEAKAKFYESVF